jgi:hypothetical protein
MQALAEACKQISRNLVAKEVEVCLLCVLKVFLKEINFFYFKLIFLFLDNFNILKQLDKKAG